MNGFDRLSKRPLGAIVLIVTALASPAATQQEAPADCPILPRALEIELALDAAPPHLRDAATVLVLESGGYVKARQGKNAFTCVVSRRGGDVFPVCWDVEGTRSLLPVELDATTLRLGGAANADVERMVADGYKSGRYHPPSRTGVAYMLSALRYRIDEQGRVTRSNPLPHVMFYGPNLTDADIGGARGSLLFMNKVGPDGMIIVPVGAKEKETILSESRSLIERFERQIGYTPQ